MVFIERKTEVFPRLTFSGDLLPPMDRKCIDQFYFIPK